MAAGLEIFGGLVATAFGVRLMLIGWGVVTPPANAPDRFSRIQATGTLATCVGLALIDAGITRLTQATGLERPIALWIFLLLGFGAVASLVWRIVEGSRGAAAEAERR